MSAFRADLSAPAQLFVGGVIVAALVALGLALPPELAAPELFLVLLASAMATATWKVRLPVKAEMTISMSYVVFLTGALLLGRFEALVIAGASAWVQCEYRPQEPPPTYRTLFSVAAVVLAVAVGGAVVDASGWQAGTPNPLVLLLPAVLAGAAFFMVNSALVATAIALATGQPARTIWVRAMLWTSPGYLLGSLLALALAIAIHRGGASLAAGVLVPVYLVSRILPLLVARVAASHNLSGKQFQARGVNR